MSETYKFTRSILLLISVICFLALYSCAEYQESMYFEMLAHGNTREQHRIFFYDGGEAYSLAYTFKDNGIYMTAIEDNFLYYIPQSGAADNSIELRRVNLNNGDETVYNEFPHRYIRQIEVEDGVIYILGATDDTINYHIYRLTREAAVRCSEQAVIFGSRAFTLGGDCLYYLKDINPSTRYLMKVSLDTMENQIINRDNLLFTYMGYWDEKIYGFFNQRCQSVAENGEAQVEEKDIDSITVNNGWLYYTKGFTPRREGICGYAEHRLYARNIKTGKIIDYGDIHIDAFYGSGAYTHLTFGKKGFILTVPNDFTKLGWEDMNQYIYYPYSGDKQVLLSLRDM